MDGKEWGRLSACRFDDRHFFSRVPHAVLPEPRSHQVGCVFSPAPPQSHLTSFCIHCCHLITGEAGPSFMYFSQMDSEMAGGRHFPIIEGWLCREKPHLGLKVSSGCCGWNEAELTLCVCVCVCVCV